ncbi:MAG: helix-turn-helix domain-containing protein [Acidobacteria bacterium]|nr:helix-turn-helix domain-containing protein [Acidobacteriota bacterium]
MKRSDQNQTLGQFLKASRETKELSLRGVEKVTGISNAYLSQLEGDKIKQPSPTLLHKLCELYGVSYSTAMELTGYPTTQGNEDTPPSQRLAARLGWVTKKEEDALVEYLEFLRSRNKGGRR